MSSRETIRGFEVGTLRQIVEDTARSHIINCLTIHNGNVTHAATQLGLSRNQLHRYIRKLDLAKFTRELRDKYLTVEEERKKLGIT